MSAAPVRSPTLRPHRMKKDESFLGKLGGTLARKKKAKEGELARGEGGSGVHPSGATRSGCPVPSLRGKPALGGLRGRTPLCSPAPGGGGGGGPLCLLSAPAAAAAPAGERGLARLRPAGGCCAAGGRLLRPAGPRALGGVGWGGREVPAPGSARRFPPLAGAGRPLIRRASGPASGLATGPAASRLPLSALPPARSWGGNPRTRLLL